MFSTKNKKLDYKKFSSVSKETGENAPNSLKPIKSLKKEKDAFQSLENPIQKPKLNQIEKELQSIRSEVVQTGEDVPNDKKNVNLTSLSFYDQPEHNRKQRILEKEQQLINGDSLLHNGHSLTYIGLFLFTLVLYFRPYELFPGLSGFNTMAQIIAIITLFIYLPTQITKENSLSVLNTEIKCILVIIICSLLSILIAKDRALAWAVFYNDFTPVLTIFVILINVLQTKRQLKGLMWLAVAISIWLSFQAVLLYNQGIFKVEGYRVKVDFGGMFGGPNDMALFLASITPISIALGIVSKNKLYKLFHFAVAGLMITGNFVTQSRGAFLALIAMAGVFVWKIGKKQRFKSILISSVVGALVITLAPGNYWLRILSIFYPSLDPAGSSDQRTELLIQSIWVTLRNPLGIGIGNFSIVGIHNHETHNAYTQVSSEIGWLALIAYMILMISPIRKLAIIERHMADREDFSWIYYMSIGLQASIISYMVSSFFGSGAYNWYVYYLIAYAICLRRIYQTGRAKDEGLI